MRMPDSSHIATFYHSHTTKTLTANAVQPERLKNVNALSKRVGDLQLTTIEDLQKNRRQSRASSSKCKLQNFTECDFFLVNREHFHAEEKRFLRWHGLRRIIKPIKK